MKKALYGSDFKRIDEYTINNAGVQSLTLMERAADGVYNELLKDCINPLDIQFIVVCGKGNNGADGLAVARMLGRNNLDVKAVLVGMTESSDKSQKEVYTTKEWKFQFAEAKKIGVTFYTYVEGAIHDIVKKSDKSCSIIIDSMVGIGLKRELEGQIKLAAIEINSLYESSKPTYVYSVDVPSGIGYPSSVIADKVITFGDYKLEMILYPGAYSIRETHDEQSKYVSFVDNIVVKKIGYADSAYNNIQVFSIIEDEDIEKLPIRDRDGHKGTFGKVAIIAGKEGMSGSSFFSAKGAYRTGCGLVKVLCPSANALVLQTLLPEAVLDIYNDEPSRQQISELVKWADSVVIGPGLGTSAKSKKICELSLMNTHLFRKKLILDADGLNILADNEALYEYIDDQSIFSPHLGEMSRLVRKDISYIKQNIIDTAQLYAKEHNVICILKDARTIITNGITTFVNTSGNDGIATAGSGDVLTGILAAMYAIYDKKDNADEISDETDLIRDLLLAACSVYIHGKAGDMAALSMEKHAIMASDIIEGLKEINLL